MTAEKGILNRKPEFSGVALQLLFAADRAEHLEKDYQRHH